MSRDVEHLIIFTRYPQPGTTKTRLIPALGAAGAAQLQRQLTESTMAQVQQLSPQPRIELCFAGGDRSLMQTWLGEDWLYQPQADGDLGDRMAAAFQAAFQQGCIRVVVIGTDCPELNHDHLAQAFHQLHTHEVVLGPATDGGYYLIGLRRFMPNLFQGIEWGSDRVFQQTMTVIQRLGISVACLDPLTDIDRPDDLVVWRRVQPNPLQSAPTTPHLSIVIPVLNEAPRLASFLSDLQQREDSDRLELIVVDGGSRDDTVQIARSQGVRVVETRPGRAHQMNVGAAIATGEILVFLHADTRLPDRFDQWIDQMLNDPQVIAGAFALQIDAASLALRGVAWGVNWRSRLLQLPYGDQALFLKATTFWQQGGFAELPIMEDYELVQRLKRQGRVAIAPVAVITSARRWQRLGVLRTTLINQLMVLGYWCGVSPERLAAWYRGRSS